MPYFGKRVMGDREFEQAEKVERLAVTVFGTKVAGEAHAALQEDAAAFAATEEPEAPLAGAYRVEDIERALDENPGLYDQLYEAELQRPEGPRVTAMRLFLQAEMSREGGVRAERQQEIERLLKPTAK